VDPFLILLRSPIFVFRAVIHRLQQEIAMKTRTWAVFFSFLLILASGAASEVIAQPASSWTPTRINKVIELWEAGQPAYYQQISDYGYDECQAIAGTAADYISINMEHSYVDVKLLRDCMRGLVDAGPTRSGHRTPAVIAVLPSIGWTEAQMRANSWMVQQVHGAGVHGILLTNSADPAAVRIMIESVRYPFAAAVPGFERGRQGAGSQGFPAQIWGIPGNDFFHKGDVYGVGPQGECIFGLKIENALAFANTNELVRIPGVSFVEHGPSDTSFWVGSEMGLNTPAPAGTPKLLEIEEQVFRAVLDQGKYFLHGCNELSWLDRGVRVCTNFNSAEAGRIHMRRQMPW
jgi:4-hydroxy-2-oxoheptanedioate aldolase